MPIEIRRPKGVPRILLPRKAQLAVCLASNTLVIGDERPHSRSYDQSDLGQASRPCGVCGGLDWRAYFFRQSSPTFSISWRTDGRCFGAVQLAPQAPYPAARASLARRPSRRAGWRLFLVLGIAVLAGVRSTASMQEGCTSNVLCCRLLSFLFSFRIAYASRASRRDLAVGGWLALNRRHLPRHLLLWQLPWPSLWWPARLFIATDGNEPCALSLHVPPDQSRGRSHVFAARGGAPPRLSVLLRNMTVISPCGGRCRGP